jgi:hypothetical protein
MPVGNVTPPPWIADLPTDARGFHAPAEAGWEAGEPILSKFDNNRTVALALRRACAVCGYSMPKGTLVYRGFGLGDALHIREFERERSHDDAGPLHHSCMLYSAIVCPYLRTNGRLGKDSLINPGAERGRRAAVMGFKDLGLMVPVLGSRKPHPGGPMPMVSYLQLTHDISYKEGAELIQRYEAAVESDAEILDTARPRLYWTDSAEDLASLKALLQAEVPKVTAGKPVHPVHVQQVGMARNVGDYVTFLL